MKIKKAYLTEHNSTESIQIDIEFAKYLQKGDVLTLFDLDIDRESVSFAETEAFYDLLFPGDRNDKDYRNHYEYVIYERSIFPHSTDGIELHLHIIDRIYIDSDEDGVLERHNLS